MRHHISVQKNENLHGCAIMFLLTGMLDCVLCVLLTYVTVMAVVSANYFPEFDF